MSSTVCNTFFFKRMYPLTLELRLGYVPMKEGLGCMIHSPTLGQKEERAVRDPNLLTANTTLPEVIAY